LKTNFLIANEPVSLRPAGASDISFLFNVYASTRADEMALLDWPDGQKGAFLQMQFNAQSSHYLSHYPSAEYFIIQCNGLDAGRLIIERSQDPLILMDIALLPEHRCRGIGTVLIQELMAEAAGRGWSVSLHVEFFNPARKLYSRLGFVTINEKDVYHEMIWRSPGAQAS